MVIEVITSIEESTPILSGKSNMGKRKELQQFDITTENMHENPVAKEKDYAEGQENHALKIVHPKIKM